MDDSASRIPRFVSQEMPKRPPSPFFVFMEGFRKEFKEKHPESKGVAAIGKAGGDKWMAMSDAEKAPFVSIAEQRKKDYEEKIKIYANTQVEEYNDDEFNKSVSEVSGDESDKSDSEVSESGKSDSELSDEEEEEEGSAKEDDRLK